MCCGKTCLKFSSLLIIVILSIICIGEILCGTYMLVYMYKINRPETIGEMHLALPSLSLLLFGIVLLPLVVLGCCGLCREVACCTNLYSSVLLVLSVLQILVGVFAIVVYLKTNTDLSDQIREDFKFSFEHFKNDPKFVNTVQKEMECCGVTSPGDWPQLPSSCCGDNEVNCHQNSTVLYNSGCVEILTDYIFLWNSIIGYSSVAIGTIEVLTTMLGFSLGCGSFRHYYKV